MLGGERHTVHRVNEHDARIVGLGPRHALVEPVGGVDDDRARPVADARHAEHVAERDAGPAARRDEVSAERVGDALERDGHGDRLHPADLVDRELERLLDEALDAKPPGRGFDARRLEVDVDAIEAIVRRDLGSRPRHRLRAIGHGCRDALVARERRAGLVAPEERREPEQGAGAHRQPGEEPSQAAATGGAFRGRLDLRHGRSLNPPHEQEAPAEEDDGVPDRAGDRRRVHRDLCAERDGEPCGTDRRGENARRRTPRRERDQGAEHRRRDDERHDGHGLLRQLRRRRRRSEAETGDDGHERVDPRRDDSPREPPGRRFEQLECCDRQPERHHPEALQRHDGEARRPAEHGTREQRRTSHPPRGCKPRTKRSARCSVAGGAATGRNASEQCAGDWRLLATQAMPWASLAMPGATGEAPRAFRGE